MTYSPKQKMMIGAGLLLGAAITLPALANTPQTISQKKRKYAPEAVTLQVGETLRVLNDDIFLHHAFIESDEMEYDSGSMEEGESRDIVFDKQGRFVMKCAIHPKMRLDITVE